MLTRVLVHYFSIHFVLWEDGNTLLIQNNDSKGIISKIALCWKAQGLQPCDFRIKSFSRICLAFHGRAEDTEAQELKWQAKSNDSQQLKHCLFHLLYICHEGKHLQHQKEKKKLDFFTPWFSYFMFRDHHLRTKGKKAKEHEGEKTIPSIKQIKVA